MLSRLTFIGFSLVLALVGPPPTQAVPSASDDEAVRFRINFGLDAAASHVAMVAKQYVYNRDIDDRYGVPLLPDEAAELDRRIEIQESLGPLRELLAMDDSAYGGHYIDQPGGGAVVVQLTGNAGPDRAALEAKLPPGASLRIERVQHSAAQLRDLVNEITNDLAALRALGVDVASVSHRHRDNRVLIGITNFNDATQRMLEERYGPELIEVAFEKVEPHSHGCISTDHCAYPMRGGVWISSCTAGFIVRRGSNTFLTTAAHCSASTTGGIFRHNGYGNLGGTYATAGFNGSRAEVKIIDMPDSQESNYVFLRTYQVQGITAWQGIYDDNEGDLVCKMGANTAVPTCGYISDTYVNTNIAGIDYIALRRANFSAVGGDSGGPVYRNNLAIGIYNSSSSLGKAYSHIGNVYQMLNVTPCLDLRCGDGGV